MANVANTASSLDLPRCFEDGAVGGCGVDVRQSGGRCVVRMAGDAGEGVMRFFEVLPGVRLSFNDFHMEECESGFAVSDEVLCVDYCFEGRMEQLLSDGTCSYVAAGDLKVDDRTRHVGRFVMPLAHYHGITVSFEVKRAQRSIERALGGFPSTCARCGGASAQAAIRPSCAACPVRSASSPTCAPPLPRCARPASS